MSPAVKLSNLRVDAQRSVMCKEATEHPQAFSARHTRPLQPTRISGHHSYLYMIGRPAWMRISAISRIHPETK